MVEPPEKFQFFEYRVTKDGVFASASAMNGPEELYPVGTKKHRIDLIANRIIRMEMDLIEVKKIQGD